LRQTTAFFRDSGPAAIAIINTAASVITFVCLINRRLAFPDLPSIRGGLICKKIRFDARLYRSQFRRTHCLNMLKNRSALMSSGSAC
jgi:hypothetical protein